MQLPRSPIPEDRQRTLLQACRLCPSPRPEGAGAPPVSECASHIRASRDLRQRSTTPDRSHQGGASGRQSQAARPGLWYLHARSRRSDRCRVVPRRLWEQYPQEVLQGVGQGQGWQRHVPLLPHAMGGRGWEEAEGGRHEGCNDRPEGRERLRERGAPAELRLNGLWTGAPFGRESVVSLAPRLHDGDA